MENQTNQVIKSAALVERLDVVFLPSPGASVKAPICRAFVALPGMLDGLVTEFPIFSKDGEISVALPGGSFKSIKAAHKLDDKGQFMLECVEHGQRKLTSLPEAIKTAYHLFLNTKNPRQSITAL